jgi:hypothetical protein
MVFFDESIEFSDILLVQIGEKVLWEKFYRRGELWPESTLAGSRLGSCWTGPHMTT